MFEVVSSFLRGEHIAYVTDFIDEANEGSHWRCFEVRFEF